MNPVVVKSLVRTLQVGGYHLVFCPIDETGSWEEIVLGGQIDGGVVFQKLPDVVLDALRERQVPIISLGDNSDPSVSQVVIDDVAGAYNATRHLIGMGHKQILFFVHESVKPHCSVDQRRQGYSEAMAQSGLTNLECLQIPEEAALDMLLRGENRPTAVLCYCNLEAMLVAHAMWQFGVPVPGELSIIAFNDMYATQHMTPPLTTVSYDAQRIGELGAQLILRDVNATWELKKPTVLTIKPRLVVRSSTGVVNSSRRHVNGSSLSEIKETALATNSNSASANHQSTRAISLLPKGPSKDSGLQAPDEAVSK
jgi:LacI family transcriptional regulator